MARTARVRFVGGMWHNSHFEVELAPTLQWAKTGEIYKLYRYTTRFGTWYWQYIHTSMIDRKGRPFDCTQAETFAKPRLPERDVLLRIKQCLSRS